MDGRSSWSSLASLKRCVVQLVGPPGGPAAALLTSRALLAEMGRHWKLMHLDGTPSPAQSASLKQAPCSRHSTPSGQSPQCLRDKP